MNKMKITYLKRTRNSQLLDVTPDSFLANFLYMAGDQNVLECPKTLKSEKKKILYDSKISLVQIFFFFFFGS